MPDNKYKNIILCSDGTGNSGGKGRGTNVWHMFLSIDQHGQEVEPEKNRPQVAFYDDGVGTSSVRIKEIIGGALGIGLGRNIRQLYTSLCKNYAEGDKIYLFGFSRGAFTVRSLAGMISTIGILPGRGLDNEDLDREVKLAYWAYRSRLDKHRDRLATRYAGGARLHKPRVHFIGVWDTVNAVGVPFEQLRWFVQRFAVMRRAHSHDLFNVSTDEPNRIDYVYHALAIGEERLSFKPQMYDESLTKRAGVKEIEQVWFAGVHSNVGGGYPKPGMAKVALAWMMEKARNRGLRFIKGAQEQANVEANVHSELYDSRSGMGAYYRYKARDLGACSTWGGKQKCRVHVSAMDRIERETKYYAPTNLPLEFKVVGTGSEQTVREESASGEASQDDEQSRIARYNKLLRDRARNAPRRDAVAPAAKLRKQREGLYYVFLAVNIALAVVLGVHELSPDIGFARIEEFSRGLRPAFLDMAGAGRIAGMLSWIGTAVSTVVELLLPEFLSEPVLALTKVPELLLVFAAIGLLMFRMRKSLIRRMRHVGVNMWRRTLDEVAEEGAA